jgi:hypothetical protein
METILLEVSQQEIMYFLAGSLVGIIILVVGKRIIKLKK